MDYVGTRLHAGIWCLKKGIRTMIIAVDNRARQIGADTGLPVIERDLLQNELADWINGQQETSITLPWDNIALWKNQFA